MRELWRLFSALGDPHRFAMVERLAKRGPLPMVRLAEGLPISRQAGAKHVSVLEAAGIVVVTRAGRERIIALERSNLQLSQMFMKQMAETWDDRLDVLRDRLES